MTNVAATEFQLLAHALWAFSYAVVFVGMVFAVLVSVALVQWASQKREARRHRETIEALWVQERQEAEEERRHCEEERQLAQEEREQAQEERELAQEERRQAAAERAQAIVERTAILHQVNIVQMTVLNLWRALRPRNAPPRLPPMSSASSSSSSSSSSSAEAEVSRPAEAEAEAYDSDNPLDLNSPLPPDCTVQRFPGSSHVIVTRSQSRAKSTKLRRQLTTIG